MKKFILVAVAAICAVVFSAFTPAEKANPPYYYFTEEGLQIYNAESPCPPGDEEVCEIMVNSVPRALYTEPEENEDYLLKWE